ncbi:MAG: hypothetical protein K2P93_07765 [Alphaproteobacteria bacterium]|nr:hypothetical protein [Alphaproteobacteria bacterium]
MEKARTGDANAQDQLAQLVYTAISRGCTFFGGEDDDTPLRNASISEWDNIDERISKDEKYRVLAVLALSREEGLKLLEKSELDPFIMGTLYQNWEEDSKSAFAFFQKSALQGNIKSAFKVVNQFLYDFEEEGGVELIPYVKFAKQHSNSEDVSYALGILYERAGRSDEAISCFEEIIQSNKPCRGAGRIYEAFYRLSKIWEEKGEFKKAELYLQNALSKVGENEEMAAFNQSKTALKIGKLLERQGRFDEAVEWYLKYHQKKDWRATQALMKLVRTHQKAQDDILQNPETYIYKDALTYVDASISLSIANLFEEKGNIAVAAPFYISAFERFSRKDIDSAAIAKKKLQELFYREDIERVRSYIEQNPRRALELADPSDPRSHKLLLMAAPRVSREKWVDNRKLIDAYMDHEGRYGIRKNLLEAARWILKARYLHHEHHDYLKTIFVPNLKPREHTVANPSLIVGDTSFTQVAGHFNRIATFLENPEFSLETKGEICPPSLQPFYLSLNSFFNLCGEALRRAEHGSGFLINCIDLSPSAIPFYGTENPKFFVRTSFDRSSVYLSVGEENVQIAQEILGLVSSAPTQNQLPDIFPAVLSECQQQALKSLGSGFYKDPQFQSILLSLSIQRASTEEFKAPFIRSCGEAKALVFGLHQMYANLLVRGKGYRDGMEAVVPLGEMTSFQRVQYQSTFKIEEFLQPEMEILKMAHLYLLRLPAELQNAIRVHVNSRNQRFLDEYPCLATIAHPVRGPLPDRVDDE